MNKNKYVFAQLIEFLDKDKFRHLVDKYNGNRYVKSFTCWNQLLALMFGQLSNRESLRDVVVALEAHHTKCYHLGIGRNPIAKTTFASANQNRDYRIFENFAFFTTIKPQSVKDVFVRMLTLHDLYERGVGKIGLICADGLKGLEDVISEVFPGTKLQRCTTHLKRNILSDVRNGDKGDVTEDLRHIFRTGDRNYTVEQAWSEWQQFCAQWGRYYRSIRKRGEDASCKAYFTYLNYDHRIQSMIYTTNWIERLQKDFRRVTRMRGAMPNEESVILLMGKTAMDKKSYLRQVPRIDLDKNLFPDE